ncbi:ATP-binding protein [Conexibacter sp. JD483]|uniref:ATP-binding protein n=1 Tax=unclassified Conexibacter TaxID=2627773 RepID=UPI00271852CA|nr:MULTISPECIES: ATP-binding protein [unclassified Conexibacter]MDO8187913.1 ATP-binding protein [Conexibacter sp. CPCC 205706]MDO8198636.1 ATP-binding protein [Conexibacter sp. CPCC 205762]MDR9369676.1 ATP-binding protein [Conexibacter sp. JD483]
MDAATNPYTPGAGTQPRALSGRERELDGFRVLRARLTHGLPERGIVLCGLRGMGKTVLLREMARDARDEGWRVSFVEMRRGTDLRDALTAAVLEQLAGLSIRERALGAFSRTMGLVRALRATIAPEIQIDVDATDLLTVGRSLEADLGELLARLGALARDQGIGVAFVIDELQELDAEGLAALCAAMHRVGQEELPIALAAAGLPSLPGLLAEAKSYAERLFAYPQVGLLPDDAARRAIVEPPRKVLGDDAPAIDDDAVERMIAFAGGYPMLLQAIGKHAWNRATGNAIGLADVVAGEQDAFDDLSRELFLARWQRATPRERDYLLAVAGAGGSCSSAEAARTANFGPTTAASVQRNTLIAKGLLWAPERGRVAFTMPLFERFVLARHEHEPAH